ncbi:MAG: hypothetical protein MJ246_03170 [Clostridia bacterium]|nr:hypothetical protein [Clostridia bacterium]
MNRYITRIMNENKIVFLNGKKEKETTDDKKAEFMFLGLRMLDGIDVNEFENKFGINIFAQYPVLYEMLEDEVLEQNENIIKLTRRGIDVSNVLFAEFII